MNYVSGAIQLIVRIQGHPVPAEALVRELKQARIPLRAWHVGPATDATELCLVADDPLPLRQILKAGGFVVEPQPVVLVRLADPLSFSDRIRACLESWGIQVRFWYGCQSADGADCLVFQTDNETAALRVLRDYVADLTLLPSAMRANAAAAFPPTSASEGRP